MRCIPLAGAPGELSAYPVPDGNPLAMPLEAAGISYTDRGMVTDINGIEAPAGSYWHFVKGEVSAEGGQWLGKESWFPDPIVDSFLGITLSDGVDVVPVVVPRFDAPEPTATEQPGGDPTPGPSAPAGSEASRTEPAPSPTGSTASPTRLPDPTVPGVSTAPTPAPSTASSSPAEASVSATPTAVPDPSAEPQNSPGRSQAVSSARTAPPTGRAPSSRATGSAAVPSAAPTSSFTATASATPSPPPSPTPSVSPLGGAPSATGRVWGREATERRSGVPEQAVTADRSRTAALVALGVAVLGGLGGSTAIGARRAGAPVEEES